MNKSLRRLTMGFVVAAAVGLAQADVDPYAGYIRLKQSDTASKHSWNQAGNWDDNGAAPSADKNYYVPAGLTFYHPNLKDDYNGNTWKGGAIAVAGTFWDVVGNHPDYAPWVKEMTLLPGSLLCVNFFGPFTTYPNATVKNSVIADSADHPVVKVAGTAANPATIDFEANLAFDNNNNPRYTWMRAQFTAESATSELIVTRPHTGVMTKTDCPYGFYLRIFDYVFADYAGVLRLKGDRLIYRPEPKYQVNLGNAAVRVEDGAELHLVGLNDETYNTTTKDAYFRQLNVMSGKLYFNCNAASGGQLYPLLNVTESLSLGSGTTIYIPYVTNTVIKGITTADPNGKLLKIAHLTGEAATVNDYSGVEIVVERPGNVPKLNLVLRTVDAGDGAKDVYICAPDVVTMNVDNTETTSGSNVQYGAFDGQHDNNWSNGQTPAADSTLNCWCTGRLCSFADLSRPDATLTIAKKMTVKGGTKVTFKEINGLAGAQLAFWNVKSLEFVAERFNLPGVDSFTIVNNCTAPFKLSADIWGDGKLIVQNQNDQGGSAELCGNNENFHGKIYLKQYNAGGSSVVTPYKFTINVADAATLGGTYTTGTYPYDGIALQNGPRLHVTETTSFSDWTRGVDCDSGGMFDVDGGKTLTIATYLTFNSKLVKNGLGTLNLAGEVRFRYGLEASLPEAGRNELEVWQGDLKVTSQKAADGVKVTFKRGTRLILDRNSQYGFYNVRWDDPIVLEDKLLVVVDGLTRSCADLSFELPLATVNATAAAKLVQMKDKIRLASGTGYRMTDIQPKTNADSSVTFVATVEKTGCILVVR